MHMDELQGQLLIGAPSIFDPNFRKTVVLMAKHDDEGAMGVVLNRPLDTTVGEAAPQLSDIVDPEERIYYGGPVQPTALVVLAEFHDPADAALTVLGDIGFVAVGTDLADAADLTRRARVFAGHSGWDATQLEAEMERDDWIVERALREDVFSADAEELWTNVLERKGGQFAFMARMPFDPSLN
jgi:putative transcriptional regulator